MRFRDDNGLFCVAGHRRAAHLTYLGLHALQHRGRSGCGLAVVDGDVIRVQRGVGPVESQFDQQGLGALRGRVALGQVYGHAERGEPSPVQVSGDLRPVVGRYKGGAIAVALAGRITNAAQLRHGLVDRGRMFHGTSDAKLIAQLVAESAKGTFVNRLVDALWQVKGAYALVVATEDRVVAVRDPMGFRPLVLGRIDDTPVVASDDSAIRFLGGEVIREVGRGEMLICEPRGMTSVQPFPKREPAQCVREVSQLTAPASFAFGEPAHAVRVALGERLGRDQGASTVDLVIGLPGTDEACAIGYARTIERPFMRGLLPAEPGTADLVAPPRELGSAKIRREMTPVPAVLAGKHVALVVPELGTGSRVKRAVQLLRESGVSDVHVRVASPPSIVACPYGVASPVTEQLALPRHGSVEALALALGVRTLAFLPLESLHEVVGQRADGHRQWCDACLSADFPIPPEAPDDQLGLFDVAD